MPSNEVVYLTMLAHVEAQKEAWEGIQGEGNILPSQVIYIL